MSYLHFRKTGRTVTKAKGEKAPFAGYSILELVGSYPSVLDMKDPRWDDSGIACVHVEELDGNAVPGCTVVRGELASYVVEATVEEVEEALASVRKRD